ncbi:MULTISPECIES: prephenate dehydratase [unclassified Streptomyces]|uniref:prephenate dehydratase n=1 Tax=unclassified Streptomyces TaxID=2593676 RepID=UPI00225C259D|nr:MULTISPECIES: prephenate dehydratase [unclassified Streptomyces]MCX4627016.1 prephenate dehydratase [Streptomyces sp. NBC_01443]WSW43172.1 prephenate dehydratase [Streptomyces sp. NBC_01001]
MSFGYLGPRGTFTESALRLVPAASGLPSVPYPTVTAALAAVRSGDITGAVVPLENSVSGTVPATLGELVSHAGRLAIDAEVEVPVVFALMAKPGTAPGDIKRVLSHPHALHQCRRWIARHIPQAEVVVSSSTAAAAQHVAESGAVWDAAAAAPEAARRYGLKVLAAGIGERNDAATRFVSVRRAGPPPGLTGRDRSTLVVTADDAGPGTLASVLAELAERNVNLAWIQAWPLGSPRGRYSFVLEVDRHIEEAQLSEAVAVLRRRATVVSLGSYPRIVRAFNSTKEVAA